MVLDVNQEVNLRLNADNRGLIAGTRGASTEIGKLNSSILSFDKSIVNNQSNLSNLKLSFDGIGQSASSFNQSITSIPNSINNLESSTSGAASAVEAFNNANNMFLRMVAPKQVKTFETLAGVISPVAKLHTDLAERTTTLGKSVELLGKVIVPFNKTIDATQLGLRNVKESLRGINVLGLDLYKTIDTFDKKLEMGQSLANFAVTADNAKNTIAEFKEELGLFGESVAETSSAVVSGVGTAFPILKTMAPQILGTLDGIGKQMGNTWVSMIGKAAKAFGAFQFQVLPVINILKSIGDSSVLLSKQIGELYKGFEVFNNLGVDTSLAALADSMGTYGENLVFNIEKTKELTTVSMQLGEQFNAQVQYIRTLTAAQSYSVKELSGKLRAAVDDDLKNVVSAGELALSVYDNVSAGIGTAAGQIGEAVKQANAAVMLAKPTGASIQETQRLINFVSTAYKKTASESADVASKLYQIVEQGVTNVAEMAANMGEVASVAAAMGLKLEDVSQSVAIATKTLGGDAYIAVKRLIESLSSMAPQSKKALQELGVTVDAQTLKTDGLFKTMQKIYKASQGNIETLKEIIPESIAFQGALTLMTSSTEDAANIMKSFEGASADSLQKLFDTQTESLTIRAERVKNAINEVFTAAGQDLIDSGLFEQPLKAMEGFADRLKNLNEPTKNFIGGMIILNQTIEKVVTIAGTLLSSLVGIGLQFTFFYTFARGGKLFGAIKEGFESTVKAAELAGQKVDYVKASLSGLGNVKNQVGKDLGFVFNIVNDFVSKVQSTFKNVYEAISNFSKNILTGNISEISKTFSSFRDQMVGQQSEISKAFSTLSKTPELLTFKDSIKDLFSQSKIFASNFFTYLKEFNFKEIRNNFSLLGSLIKESFTSGIGAIRGLNVDMLTMFKNTKLGSIAFGTLNGIMIGSKAVMTTVGATAKLMWSSILAPALPLLVIVGVLGAIRDFIPAFGSATDKANQFAKSLEDMRDSTGRASAEVRNLQKELGEKTGASAKKFDTFINTWIINPLKWIFSFPGNMVKAIQDALPKLLGSIPIIGGTLKKLTEGLVSGFRQFGDFVYDVGEGFKNIVSDMSEKLPPVISHVVKFVGEATYQATSFFASLMGDVEKFDRSVTQLQNHLESAVDKEAVNAMHDFLKETDNLTTQLQTTLAKTTSSNPFEGLTEEATKNLGDYEKSVKDYIATLSDTNEEDQKIKARLEKRLEEKKSENQKFLDAEKEYQEIIKKAREENRSLSPEETNTINNNRKTAFEYRKTMIKDELALLETNYDKMKEINEEEAKAIKERIDLLNKQLTIEEQRQESLKKQTQTLNEFTKQINRETKALSDLLGESNTSLSKNISDMSTKFSDLSKNVNNVNKEEKEMLLTNIEATASFQTLLAETDNFTQNLEKSGSKINYFQQRTMSSFIGSIKELGLSIDDINTEEFDPAEFRSKIQSAVENSMEVMEQFGDNPEMTKRVLDTLKNTQIAYLDETGQIVKTTLEKTLSPEQLQELIEVRLQVIDNLTNKEIEKLERNNIELQDKNKEHFSKLEGLNSDYSKQFEKSRLDLLDKQNKNNRKSREVEIKSAQDKLKIIEEEFGKESTQYKEQYKKLLELQRTNRTETLNEQKNLLNERLDLFQKYQEKERIALETSLEQGNLSSLQFAKQNKQLTQSNFKEREKALEAEIQLNRKNGESILDLENELSKLRLDKIKETRDAELKILEEKYEEINRTSQKEALKNRLNAIDGESQQELKIRQKQENKELETKRSYLIEQMRLYGRNSSERKKLEMELHELEVTLAEKAYKDKEELMQKELDLKIGQINKIKALNDRDTILGSNIDDFRENQELQEQELNLYVNNLKEKIKLTQEGTAERLQLETELINKENQLLKSQVEFRKQVLDDQYRKDKFELSKQNIQNQKDLLDGQTEDELNSQLELSEKQIQLEIQNINERIKLTKEGSQERIDLMEQLLNTELELEKQQIEKRKQLLQENFEKEQDLIKNELTKFRLNELDGLTTKEIQLRQKLQKQELETTKQNIINQIELYEEGSKERRKLEQQLLETEVQLQQQALEQRKELLQKEFNLRQGNIDKIIELEKRSLIDGTSSDELNRIDNLEQSKLQSHLNYLNEQIKLTEANTEERLQLETQIEQVITQLQTKEQEKRKRNIEDKYQELNRTLETILINQRKQLIDGATLQELDSINNLEKETINIKLNSLKEQLSLYDKNSKEYKDIQQQILQTELDLEQKSIQIRKDSLDKKLELEIALLDKVKIANEELSLNGTTQEDLKQIQNASRQETQIRIDNIKEQLKFYQEDSIERIKLENELQRVILDNKKNEIDIRKQLIEEELSLEKNKLQEIKLLNEKNTIRGTTQEDLNKIQETQQKEIELTINNLKDQLGLYETNSKERKSIELQLQQELNNLDKNRFENQKQLLQNRFDLEQQLNNQNRNDLEKLLLNSSVSREEYDRRNLKLQQEALLNEQQLLNAQLDLYKQGSKEYYDTLNQLSSKQLEYQRLVIEESVRLLEKEKQQININAESSKQNIEKLSNAQDRYISNLEFESKMKQTDLDITKALMNADISRLEFSLTQTGDLVEKAEINLKIKQKQIEISNKEIEIQIDNLNQQTKINKLNLEKEKIQIRLNKLDIERNVLQTKLEIKQAKLQNKSKEEITILEQQLDSLKNQNDLLNQRERDLIRNNELEQNITEGKLQELEIQKEINSERNKNEIEIAKQEKLLAILEKQKEQVLYRYEKSILAQEKELKALDHIQKVEESRLKTLQQRQSTLNDLMGLFDTSTQMSSEGAVSEAKRDHLAKKNAEMKYKMLQITQNIERQNLEMEMKQTELANKRLQIEHERAKLTSQSNLRQAEFDAKRVLMDKTASDIDKQRAMDLIESRKDELIILDQQSSLIEDQIRLSNESLQDRRKLIDFKQGIEDLQGRKTIAQTTKNTADDVAISNEAFNMTNVLSKTLIQNMNQFKEIQTPTIEINRKMEATLSRLNNTIEKQMKSATSPNLPNPVNVSKLADININLNDKNVSAAVPDIKRQIYDALNNVVVAANQQNITPSF